MRFLITTMAGDFHAAVIALELRARGNDVQMFFGEDNPCRQTQSARVGRLSLLSAVDANGEVIDFSKFDVVWNRRRMAYSTPETLHEDDIEFVRDELRACADGIWSSAAQNAFWVNNLDAAARARHKLNQLIVARDIGFNVPETLMTNNSADIHNFMKSHSSVVYKSFTPATWDDDSGKRALFAKLLLEEDLPKDPVLQLCPGIYQQYVKQKFEVRVTVFGQTVIALKLRSAGSTRKTIDCREGHMTGLDSEEHALPMQIEQKLRDFMRRYDLRFGCFDLIMSDDGDYYFLEVNEAGQFLWIEELQPSIPMLDAFCGFLESTDDEYLYRPGSNRASLAEWQRSGQISRLMRPLKAVSTEPVLVPV
jgi:glutathione synthase/RimK-type ligase-like ATP-grasp enzyme